MREHAGADVMRCELELPERRCVLRRSLLQRRREVLRERPVRLRRHRRRMRRTEHLPAGFLDTRRVRLDLLRINDSVPGATVSWVARKLGLEKPEPPVAPAMLTIESRQQLTGDLLHFYIDHEVAAHDVTIEDLSLPDTAAVTVVVRGETLVPARPETVLMTGDHVYLIARPEDRGVIQLLFGRPEEE